jgi:uncharacterized membrane protein
MYTHVLIVGSSVLSFRQDLNGWMTWKISVHILKWRIGFVKSAITRFLHLAAYLTHWRVKFALSWRSSMRMTFWRTSKMRTLVGEITEVMMTRKVALLYAKVMTTIMRLQQVWAQEVEVSLSQRSCFTNNTSPRTLPSCESTFCSQSAKS